MSDTPRTDAEICKIKDESKHMDKQSAYYENYQAMRDFSRVLERELAAMTEKRDALFASNLMSASELCRTHHVQKCDSCDDLGCCDNTSPAKTRIGEIERAACEAIRAGIVRCSLNGTGFEGCKSVIAPCHLLTAKTCPLRAYLDSKKQPDAWEVKP